MKSKDELLKIVSKVSYSIESKKAALFICQEWNERLIKGISTNNKKLIKLQNEYHLEVVKLNEIIDKLKEVTLSELKKLKK